MTKIRRDKSGLVRPTPSQVPSGRFPVTGTSQEFGVTVAREYITRKSLGISGNTCDRETLQVAPDVKKPQVRVTTKCRPEFFNT